jgi:hypothetical protein
LKVILLLLAIEGVFFSQLPLENFALYVVDGYLETVFGQFRPSFDSFGISWLTEA